MTHRSLFDSATVRLTLWYLLILSVLSILFSFIVYSLATHEFERAAGPRRQDIVMILERDFDTVRQQRIEDSNRSLVTNLVLFNILTITSGGLASYFLARRTLRPIREAMESQARFSSDAAHELRTPLAVMQSEIEVELRDKKSSKASHAVALTSNLDEVQRMQTLTERLLMLGAQQETAIGPVSVEQSAIDAVNRLITPAQAKSIAIENNVGAVMALTDQASLTDLLTIVIDNAIKYSPNKTTITLDSHTTSGRVEVRVADQGIGMSADETTKIFDRFYRADTSRSKTNVEGHGLGLSIAQRIADTIKATIRVESELGKGSTFTISLPLAKK